MSGYRKLGRPTDHRRAMLRGMVTYLLENGSIETTLMRAKEVRRIAEKMITLGKNDTLHSKRQALSYITKEDVVKKLFDEKEIVCEAYTFSETTELQTVTAAAAAACKAIYVPSDNTVATSDSIVGSVCTQNKVPVFTSYGGSICYASLAIDYYRLGVLTGEMAADVLLGNKQMSDLEVLTSEPTKVYNEDICKSLGITVPAV